MPQNSVTEISEDEARTRYGIISEHVKMENGELRFRLKSCDGSGYVRTASAPESGWQKSHFHENVLETYVVQSGWMALASLCNDELVIDKYDAGEVITTERLVPHNVYLPDNAVIHTVKHGNGAEKNDWHPCDKLDKLTKSLTELDINSLARACKRVDNLDARFNPYIDVYNNLDNLIWQVPGFFIASAAIVFGFLTNSMTKESIPLPPVLWAGVFLFVGLLFLIGTYSMYRIRLHHTRMGNEIKRLEPSGYFNLRSKSVNTLWPPSAPHVFMVFFATLGAASLVAAALALTQPQWLIHLIQTK